MFPSPPHPPPWPHVLYLDAVDLHKVRVLDALEDPELVGDPPDGAVVVGLQRQHLHGHQLAGLVVHGSVHLAEPTAAWGRKGSKYSKPCSSLKPFFVASSSVV